MTYSSHHPDSSIPVRFCFTFVAAGMHNIHKQSGVMAVWDFYTKSENTLTKEKNKNKKNELVTSHSRSNTGIFTFRNFYIVHKIFWANLFLCRCDAHLKTEVSNKLQKCSCSFIFLHCLYKKCSVQVPFCTDVRKAHWGRLLPEVYPWPHGIQTTASIWFCR